MNEQDSPPQIDLSKASVIGYIHKIDGWKKDILSDMKAAEIPSRDRDEQLRTRLLILAKEQDPELMPLVKSKFSAEPDQIPQGVEPEVLGQPLQGEGVEIAGHTGYFTVWLGDKNNYTMQSVKRIILNQNGQPKIVDIYSDPVNTTDRFDKELNRNNDERAFPSQAVHLLEYIRGKNIDVLGAAPIVGKIRLQKPTAQSV